VLPVLGDNPAYPLSATRSAAGHTGIDPPPTGDDFEIRDCIAVENFFTNVLLLTEPLPKNFHTSIAQ